MSKCTLIAVHHEVQEETLQRGAQSTSLLGTESRRFFSEHIIPKLTPRSLVLVEGIFLPVPIKRQHPKYKQIAEPFGEAFAEIAPSLGGYDPRWKDGSIGSLAGTQAIFEVWIDFVRQHLLPHHAERPSTFSEVLRTLAQKPELPVKSMRAITPSKKELANRIRVMNQQFDREYTKALTRHKERYDQCFLVAGSSHCVSIALKTGLPIEYMFEETEKSVRELCQGYLMYYGWPALVSQHNPGAAA